MKHLWDMGRINGVGNLFRQVNMSEMMVALLMGIRRQAERLKQ